MTAQNEKVYLTEGDCFMLALEKKHMHQTGISNNTCRYLLTVDGYIAHEEFRKKINNNHDLTWLASLVPEKRFPLSLPRWKVSAQTAVVPVWIHESEEFLPAAIVARKISIDAPPSLTFDIIYRSNGDSTLLFSWHHLLMDGHGAILLLKQIAKDIATTSPYLYDHDKRALLGLRSFWQAARAKFFVDRVSKKPLSGIMDLNRKINKTQKIKILNFSKDETIKMDEIAPRLGAQFGRSPFYLACAARTVCAILKKRDIKVHDFWIPVPRNQRKMGAKGPVLGNHIAFLFFRLKRDDLNSFAACVSSINEQTKSQIRSGMAKAYDLLTRFLRRTPLPLYYFWIKGPKGGSLASFLFTVAADHPEELSTFDGHKVKEALSIPSNIYPPGLTFAFMHSQGCLQLMVLYFEGLLQESEIEHLEKQIRHELLTGTEFNDENY
ncbi:MAG: hypothetical protein OEV74_10380 [Cyclobacteriaceae bacterium]|nr:hypothetical protein [Cyclobacteriaceae bacterium]MDH4296676.1 hypothetical protein [Cyclobacteriaceae bacterium]MDH5248086.1 hypothetical protein [Cyclobacteriaceae bacterium]